LWSDTDIFLSFFHRAIIQRQSIVYPKMKFLLFISLLILSISISVVTSQNYFQIASYAGSGNCTGIPETTTSQIEDTCYQLSSTTYNYVTCNGTAAIQQLCSNSNCNQGCNTTYFPQDQCANTGASSSAGFSCGVIPDENVKLNYWTGSGCTGNLVSVSYYAVDTCIPVGDGTYQKYRCCGPDIDLDTCTDSGCTTCTTAPIYTSCNSFSVFYTQYVCNGTGAGTTGCSSPGFTTTTGGRTSNGSVISTSILWIALLYVSICIV